MMNRTALLAVVAGLVAGGLIWLGFGAITSRPEGASEVATVSGEASTQTEQAGAGTGAGVEEEEPPPVPFDITLASADLAAALEAAPYVRRAEADGPALYMIGFRSCPGCIEFKTMELDRLAEAGIDVRLITYARRDREGKERSKPGERAMVAEIALTRDWALHEAWMKVSPDEYYQSAELPPAAESSPERLAALEAGRAAIESLSDIVEANGQQMAVPALFWQEDGVWRGMIGYEEAAFAPVRLALARGAAEEAPGEPAPAVGPPTP